MSESFPLENNKNIQTSSRLEISWVKRSEESVMIIEARARFYRLQATKIYPKLLFIFNSVTTCRFPGIFLVSPKMYRL